MNARQLQAYAIQQALAHQDEIAPELMDYIGGDSKAAIDASIAKAKAASAALVQRAMQSQIRPHDQDDPGPMFTSNVQEGISDQSVPDVSNWTLDEYGKHRDQLIRRRTGEGVGIFGPIGH